MGVIIKEAGVGVVEDVVCCLIVLVDKYCWDDLSNWDCLCRLMRPKK